MARTSTSPEARILQWFRTAPPSAVGLLMGLIKDIVRVRKAHVEEVTQVSHQPTARTAVRPPTAAPTKGRTRPPMSQAKRDHLRKAAKARWAKIRKATAAPPHYKNWTSSHARKSHHKKKPHQAKAVASGAGKDAEEAQVEDFEKGMV